MLMGAILRMAATKCAAGLSRGAGSRGALRTPSVVCGAGERPAHFVPGEGCHVASASRHPVAP